jgi:nucleoredoxin
MRSLLLALLVAGTSLSALQARSLPLTLKEINLMLRSGFSSENVQQELSVRHLAESCDEAAEANLREAGATPALIGAIKSGSFASSPEDAQSAREELAAQTAKRTLETERLRKSDTVYQDQLARARAVKPPANGDVPSALTDSFKGDLVFWKNGSIARFDDEPLAKKKLIALYFSARWCDPCRKFTPQLVEFYNLVAPQHPEFEIIFISNDRSPFGMETYLQEMPWPAIEFSKVPGKTALKKYAGDSIPCLVLLDASGKVISDSYSGKTYLGPEKVLADLAAIFAQTSPATITGAR